MDDNRIQGNQVLKLPKISNSSIQVNSNKLNKVYYPNHRNINLKQYNPPNPYKLRSKSVISFDFSLPIEISKIIDQAQKLSQVKYIMNQQNLERKNIFHNIEKNRIKFRQASQKNEKKLEESINLKKVIAENKKKIQSSLDHKIKKILQQITPLNSSEAFLEFISKSQNMKKLVKKSKDQQIKIQRILQSKKINGQRKYHLLEIKKKQMESEIEKQYDLVFSKYFSQEKVNDEFKKKFQQNLKQISKNLVITPNQ